MNLHYHQTNLHVPSGVHGELKQGFDRWVKGLRQMTIGPEPSYREAEKEERAPQSDSQGIESKPRGCQWDEEGRWQDDGGHCVSVR